MRRFKSIKKINWKYILSEIFLIFVGINLAIWFNDWNTTQKINQDKKTALVRIEDEIKNNLNELTKVRTTNQSYLNAYSDFDPGDEESTSIVVTTPEHLDSLQNKYPGFFTVFDSTAAEGKKYTYRGEFDLYLELPELSEIAWKTANSINVTNSLHYDCLYELESLYNLQRRVDTENKLLMDAILTNDKERLARVLLIMGQMELQLLKDYEHILTQLKNCN
ncbi:MAG: hypothetical protein AAFZ15_15410 [Bacteroidota bacterium]